MVMTDEFAEHGNISPQLTKTLEPFNAPEQEEGPTQVVVGAEQAAPLMIETEELLKLSGRWDGATQA
jgi:hypothetical protein